MKRMRIDRERQEGEERLIKLGVRIEAEERYKLENMR